MGNLSDPRHDSSEGISMRVVVIFLTALGLSSLVLNYWGDRLVVRAILGVAWGGYCLVAFGPGLARFLRRNERRDTLS